MWPLDTVAQAMYTPPTVAGCTLSKAQAKLSRKLHERFHKVQNGSHFDNLQSGSHLCTKSLHMVVCRAKLYECCRSFDPRMGTTGRVLWEAVPELLHLGAVIVTAAVMVGVMGNTLFGYRAEAMSTLSCMPLHPLLPWHAACVLSVQSSIYMPFDEAYHMLSTDCNFSSAQ